MKKILPFYLYPGFFKLIGIVISITGIFLSLLLQPDYQMLFYFGLFFVIFSKEKNETELTVKIRGESFKTVLGYILALMFVFYLMGILYDDFIFPTYIFLLVGVPMLLYIIYFNLLLLINVDKQADDRKNMRQGYLLWIVFALVSAGALSLQFFI